MLVHGATPKTDPELIRLRIEKLEEMRISVSELFHSFDGTQHGAPYGAPEMRVAADYLETAFLWVEKCVKEN